ncbi:DJ-1/PfpI family protein [Cellulomonas hominis]
MPHTRTVGILVYDDVEVLDACGPFEVFSVAARISPAPTPFRVVLVADQTDRPVRARHGLRLLADHGIADAPDLDVLLVPGGVTTAVEEDAAVVGWIAARRQTPVIASVCTGAFLLARAGILTDQTVTTHWEDQAELTARYPALTVVDGPRWVRAGDVFTSAGISAGIDLSLHLVGHLAGTELAVRTARQMDYDWAPAGS